MRLKKAKVSTNTLPAILFISCTAPSLAEMRLDLTENENRSGVNEGAVSWLGLGIALEDAQCLPQLSVFICFDCLTHHKSRDKLRWEIRRLTKYSTVGDKTKIAEKRQRLGRRILAFHSKSSAIIGELDPDHLTLNEADIVAGSEIPDSGMVGSDGEEGDEPDDP